MYHQSQYKNEYKRLLGDRRGLVDPSSSQMAQPVKTLPAMQEMWVRPLGQEDPLRRKWWPTPESLPKIPHGRKSLVGPSSWGRKESDAAEQLSEQGAQQSVGRIFRREV